MKKIIYRSFIVILFILIVSVIYLSTFGIETTRFNSQISNYAKNIKNGLDVDLKKIKIFLNLTNLSLSVKTVGTKIKYKKKIIETNSIKTHISLNSLIKKEFLLKNLEVSTKSLEINNLISFVRTFQKTPELFLLERFVKNGYLIADIKLDFDSNGKIKKNYEIKGFVKDVKLGAISQFDLKKLNFSFNYKKNNLVFNDASFLFNDLNFFSKNIDVTKQKNEFLVSGNIENKKIDLSQNSLDLFKKYFFSDFGIQKIKFTSKNDFTFIFNKKLDFKNLKIDSKVSIDELEFLNQLELKKFFPQIGEKITFLDNNLKIAYKKNKLSLQGEGDITFQNQKDYISYNLIKNKDLLNFETSLKIKNNPFSIKIINYEKDLNNELNINLKGVSKKNKIILINSVILKEKINKIEINDLLINDKYKIVDIEKIKLDYVDKDKKRNLVELNKKNKEYILSGSSLNVNFLLDQILNDSDTKNNFLNIKNKLNINVKKIFLDSEYYLKNLVGFLILKDQNIPKANIIGNFSNDKKLRFTINTQNNEKITTLYSDNAKPIVKRYKFIKGFDDGSLDFYGSKKLNTSISTLKIYNFKLKELPILTKILTLASLQGIADILSGDGIRFDEFEMNFQDNGNLIKIDEIYAIGPAISILMDGYIEKNKLISLRGTLVPATTINKAIGTIPILGKLLVGSKTGEGVFGVSFKIKGPPKKLETTVNPIKTLTPRFITRTLEKIKKN